MPIFTANYPFYQAGQSNLIPTPQRVSASSGYTGRGVVIAFIDAGFYPHPDLAGRILIHVDASTNHVIEQDGTRFGVSELSWHGQMTTVVACGNGSVSSGKYQGIASNSQLVLVKVSTPRGQVKERDIMRGLQWIIDTHCRFNIRIVNLSVGGDFESHDAEHPIFRAVRKLTDAGITVVAAAGNRGLATVVPPASSPDAITIGGINDSNSYDKSLWTAYPNNYGISYNGSMKPDLTAPAVWIPSPILPGSVVAREARWLASMLEIRDKGEIPRILKKAYADLGLSRQIIKRFDDNLQSTLQNRIHIHKIVDAHHQHVDGTSVAAPIVTSVIAQMLEANPRLTPQQIRAILASTASQLPAIPAQRQGAGVINAAEAVTLALNY